jgi:hypothetical protein
MDHRLDGAQIILRKKRQEMLKVLQSKIVQEE